MALTGDLLILSARQCCCGRSTGTRGDLYDTWSSMNLYLRWELEVRGALARWSDACNRLWLALSRVRGCARRTNAEPMCQHRASWGLGIWSCVTPQCTKRDHHYPSPATVWHCFMGLAWCAGRTSGTYCCLGSVLADCVRRLVVCTFGVVDRIQRPVIMTHRTRQVAVCP